MNEFIDPNEDVVRRGINRDLPCKLTDEEFMRIAKTRVTREAEYDEHLNDLAIETKRRKDQMKALEDEIAKMRRELHTGHQDRNIKCNEVFRRHPDGTGWIYVVRLDTMVEVERRPASAAEMQRYLPGELGTSPGTGLLDVARSAQAAEERAEGDDDVPSEDDVAGDAGASDDAAGETSDETPKKKRRGAKS